MSFIGKLFRFVVRILFLFVIVLAGIWLVVSRPTMPEPENPGETVMVNQSMLKQHVNTLCSNFSPRDFRHSENLVLSSAYIANLFRLSGALVYEHSFEVEGVGYKNVIAEYGPNSPSVIVVGAHYDAVVGTPGADDNASGIAGILELARLFSKVSFPSRVVLAAYTLEEPPFYSTGLMGSAAHARVLKDENVDVRLMICFEMIGYFADEPGSQQFPVSFLKLYYPSTGNFIAIVDQLFSTQSGKMKRWMRKTSDLPVHSINAPRWLPGVDWSDHRNFWKQGYPAVMITDTAFYRNAAYHSANDTPERLDYEKMAKVVQGVYGYVLHLSGGVENSKEL